MRKWIAVRKQRGEGCDYTIGCGYKWHIIEADTAVEALRVALREASVDDWNEAGDDEPYGMRSLLDGDFAHDTFTIYPVAALAPIDVLRHAQGVVDRWEDALAAKNKTSQEERERAELKRLQEKYSNG